MSKSESKSSQVPNNFELEWKVVCSFNLLNLVESLGLLTQFQPALALALAASSVCLFILFIYTCVFSILPLQLLFRFEFLSCGLIGNIHRTNILNHNKNRETTTAD